MNSNEFTMDKKKFISDHKILKIDDLPNLLENFTVENVSNFLKSHPEYIDRQDKKTGSTLIYRSVMLGANDVTEFLLSLKANTDIPNINGETPLFLSVEESNYKIINLLLEAGANPNIQNHDGETPMHIAALKGDYKVIKLLLLFGANPYLNTVKNKYSPLDYAKEKNKVKCIEVLEPLFADDGFENNFKNKFTNSKSSKDLENSNNSYSNFKKSINSSFKTASSNNKNNGNSNYLEPNSPDARNLNCLSNTNTNYLYPSNTNSNSFKKNLNREPIMFKSDTKLNLIPKNISHPEDQSKWEEALNTGYMTSKNSNFKFEKVKTDIDFSHPSQIRNNNILTTRHSKIPIDRKTQNHTRNLSVTEHKRKPPIHLTDSRNNLDYDSNKLNQEFNEVLERMNSNSSQNFYKNYSDKKQINSYENRNDHENLNEISNGRSNSVINSHGNAPSDNLKKNYSSNLSNNSLNNKIELSEFDSFRNDSKHNYLTSKNKKMAENKFPIGFNSEGIDENVLKFDNKSFKNRTSDVNLNRNESENYEDILVRENSKASDLSDNAKISEEPYNKKMTNLYTELDRKDSNNICQSNENSFRESSSFMKKMNNFEERLEKMKIDFIKNSTDKGKGLSTAYEDYLEEVLNEKNNQNSSLFNRDKLNQKFSTRNDDDSGFNNMNETNQKNKSFNNYSNNPDSSSNGYYPNFTNKSLTINRDNDIFQPISPQNNYSNTTKNDNKNSNMGNNLNVGLNIMVDLITTPKTRLLLKPNFNTQLDEINKSKFMNREQTEDHNLFEEGVEPQLNRMNEIDRIRTSTKSIHQTPNFPEIDGKRRDFTEHLKNVHRKKDSKNKNNINHLNNKQNTEEFSKDEFYQRENKEELGYNENLSNRNHTKHQKNFTLFNNNFTNSKNFIDSKESSPEERNNNEENQYKKHIQKRNSYHEPINMNVDLEKMSYKYLNMNLQKNKLKTEANNKNQDLKDNRDEKVESSYMNNHNSRKMERNLNDDLSDNPNVSQNIMSNRANKSKNFPPQNNLKEKNFDYNYKNTDQRLIRVNDNLDKNNLSNFTMSGFEVNRIDTDDNLENNYPNFKRDDESFSDYNLGSKNNQNSSNNFYPHQNFYRNKLPNDSLSKSKNEKSMKNPMENQSNTKIHNHNQYDSNFTLSNKDFDNRIKPTDNNSFTSKSNGNRKKDFRKGQNINNNLIGDEDSQENNDSKNCSYQNNDNIIISLKPSEYIDTQDNRSINTRITYDSNLNQNNLEDDSNNYNTALRNKNKNYAYLNSKISHNFWNDIENKIEKKINRIPMSNHNHKGLKKVGNQSNRNMLNINNEFEEVQDSRSFEKNFLSNRIMTHKNKGSIYSENYNPKKEGFNIENFDAGCYSTRKKSVNERQNSTTNLKSNTKIFRKKDPLKESFKDLGRELAIFFSSKNDIILEDNKENILSYNQSHNYVNKLGEMLNNDEEDASSNNFNNISNGNFIQETFNNEEEDYTINTNRMIQRRKIKYFSKSNKSLKEEFKQISLDTQALDESLKNIGGKKNQQANKNRNQTTTSNISQLNTNLTKTNTNSNGVSNQKYVSLMSERSNNQSSNRMLNNYDYLLNQNRIVNDLTENNNQEDNQVYYNNSYLDFETNQFDSCLRTLEKDLNMNLNNNNNNFSNRTQKDSYGKSIRKTDSRIKSSKAQSSMKNTHQESNKRNDRKLELKDLVAETSNVLENETPVVTEQYSEIQHFMRVIYLENYTNTLVKNGFDDINILINQMKTKNALNDKMLKDIGISVPGYRAKILIKLEEKAHLFDFDVPSLAYYSVGDPSKIKSSHILNDSNIKGIFTWLSALKMERFTKNLVMSGYHSMELLLIQMASKNPLDDNILCTELQIEKIGYRNRILNKLKEDSEKYVNQLRSNMFMYNNNQDSRKESCKCLIF